MAQKATYTVKDAQSLELGSCNAYIYFIPLSTSEVECVRDYESACYVTLKLSNTSTVKYHKAVTGTASLAISWVLFWSPRLEENNAVLVEPERPDKKMHLKS